MNRLSIFSEESKRSEDIRRVLAGHFDVRVLGLEGMLEADPEQFTVVDVLLKQAGPLLVVKEWLKRKPKNAKAILVVDRASRIEVARAYAIGATDIVDRPINGRDLLSKLSLSQPDPASDFATLAAHSSWPPGKDAPGLAAAVDTLQNLFSTACLAETVDAALVDAASEAVVGQIDAQGLASWVDAVRTHHSQTYQHCMLVTGVAVAFGKNIGLSQKDQQRLSIAGMLHDIGKARIPLAILEKPGPLDQNELLVMRQHPVLGIEALQSSGLNPEMLDMVLHHHEYLDGSGYPHGLSASEIPDLVRIMTISDVFGALIERRSYKPPLSSDAAYQILLDMGPKLDKDLTRAFRPTSELERSSQI